MCVAINLKRNHRQSDTWTSTVHILFPSTYFADECVQMPMHQPKVVFCFLAILLLLFLMSPTSKSKMQNKMLFLCVEFFVILQMPWLVVIHSATIAQ